METQPRKPYPSDVADEEWAFVAPYLMLMTPNAPQRHHELRDVYDALRWIVRVGASWRMLPTNFPPWAVVYQQTQRWLKAGVFETMVHDLRALSTPESGDRAGHDGAKRKNGSKLHLAVDTLGHLLALHVTPANVQDRAQVGELATAVQDATGDHVTLAYVDHGYTGETPAAGAAPGVRSLPWGRLD